MKSQRPQTPQRRAADQRWALWVQAAVLLGVTVVAGVTTLLIS